MKLAFANHQGGGGKSAMTIQTAFYAAKSGMNVLVVDLSGQGNTSASLAGRKTLEDLCPFITRSYQLFRKDLKEPHVLTCAHGVDLIPAKINDELLFGLEVGSMESSLLPRQNLEKISDNYDLILIDCPSSLGRLIVSGLIMADKVIMPIQPAGFCTDSISGMLRVIERLNKAGHEDLEIAGILINNIGMRSRFHQLAVKALREKAGDWIFNTVIACRDSINQATTSGKPIWKLKSGAARLANKEITRAIEEIFSRLGIEKHSKPVHISI